MKLGQLSQFTTDMSDQKAALPKYAQYLSRYCYSSMVECAAVCFARCCSSCEHPEQYMYTNHRFDMFQRHSWINGTHVAQSQKFSGKSTKIKGLQYVTVSSVSVSLRRIIS